MYSTSVRIDPLNAENYDTWKLQMRAILIKNDLWSYVDGTVKCPTEEQGAEAKASWLVRDCKASADITLSISPGELSTVNECTTAKEMWDKLKDTYQSRGPAKKATLLKRVALARLKDGDNVRDHLNEFFDAVKKLKDIGVHIGEELLAILLLYSLPHSYETFRCALETRDNLPKPDALRVKILEESESRKANDERVEHDAFYANKNNQNLKSNESACSNKRNTACFKCGKIGHYANNCRTHKKRNHLQNSGKAGKHLTRNNTQSETVLCSTESAFYGFDISQKWCLDSGCTSHMTSNLQYFENMTTKTCVLHLANGEKASISGVGYVRLNELGVKLSEVLYVPGLRTNLLSISKITDKGFKVRFENHGATILDCNNKLILTAERIGNLYFLKETESVSFSLENKISNITDWHQKMGHLNEKDLLLVNKNNLVHGLNLKSNKLQPCEICISEKQIREKFVNSTIKTTEPLEIVHSDVCGPFRVNSLSGGKYFVTFIDDYSRWCVIYIIKQKSELLKVFKKYKMEVELKTGHNIKTLQTDNGTEYCNREFDEFLESCGITRQLSAPYTPQQNGVAERKNRTLLEMARCLLKQAGATPNFWGEAINTACYIRNRCPSKAINNEIPYKLWTGKTPTVSHFKIFGTKAYVLNKGNKSKLESRSFPCIFVGYSLQSKAYRLWCPKRRSIIISRDVKFMNQSGFEQQDTHNMTLEKTVECILDNEISTREDATDVEVSTDSTRSRGRPRILRTGLRGRPKKVYRLANTGNNTIGNDNINENQADQEINELNSPITEEDDYESANLVAERGPDCLNEALESNDAEFWRNALNKEFMAQLKGQTWQIVPRPETRKIIGYRYVFTTKENGTKKARLVAKGCSQRRGVDFTDTFSPVVRFTSIRVLAALASELNLEIHQMDVVAAYLNGDLNETVYMETPDYLRNFLEEFISTYSDVEHASLIKDAKKWLGALNSIDDNVCLLKKALYGLRQSGLSWYHKLQSKLLSAGLIPTNKDPCLFVKSDNDKLILVTIYVDDLLIASNNAEWISWLKSTLAHSFEMKDMGLANTCLGIQFTQNLKENSVHMSQQRYIYALLNRFGMNDCKSAKTPIEMNCKLVRPHEKDIVLMEKFPYQQLIGSLMYLAVCSRPDIAYAVNFLSQFNSNYNEEHWKAAKRVLRYLQGTSNFGLSFQKTGKQLHGFADADWAADLNDRRSFTGYNFILGGASISWEARKQRTVALSSTEAEYMALSSATKECLYLKSLLQELGLNHNNTTLFNDNQSALKLAEGVGYNSRTKHIDIRHHFIRECLQSGIIRLVYMPTEEMPADVLTKGLSVEKHLKCITTLGVENL